MNVIREKDDSKYRHYLDEAEEILVSGGMDQVYAHNFVQRLHTNKSNHVIERSMSKLLQAEEYRTAGQNFVRAEKHNTNAYDWDQIDNVRLSELGEALGKVREYLIGMRFKKK